jgi:hypothetical protein
LPWKTACDSLFAKVAALLVPASSQRLSSNKL